VRLAVARLHRVYCHDKTTHSVRPAIRGLVRPLTLSLYDAATDEPGPARANESPVRRLRVVPNFFAQAIEMRRIFDERMGRERSHGQESFVWDYWHVPGQYTYLRTFGNRYFPEPLTGAFLSRL
jgi:hypothetical protein